MVALSATMDRSTDRVRLVVSSAPAGATTCSLERSPDAAAWTPVRRGTGVALSGGAVTVDDYEFSPAVLNYYRVTSVGTSVTEQAMAPITPDPARCWIKFPTDPASNIPLVLTGWGEISRAARSTVLPIINSANPAVLSELMSTRALTISIRTADDRERRTTDTALARGLPILLALHPGHAHALDSMYAVVSEVRYDRPAARSRAYRWVIGLTEIGPLDPAVGGFRTYADLKAATPTYAALL